ncbi:YbaB/EbfC family nucleoid-associated protein [Mycobacterium sp. 1465703.0]|uniref:YbaB/EbfC family nucleoid-associated protein n=1 Tax=Mycobacterium sp. 1465703.0 TaxID=1834078 RepID=UPI0012EA53E4|nr:YbaB/EbfC family nucleoid-associated protein [Mycobacterium sp. 1465703.0]
MDSDGLRGELGHMFSLVQEQMREMVVMQQKQTALTATGTAADGMVKVSVDARRIVTKTVIDESYLDEFEFADLSGHITDAAQSAVQEIEQRSADLLAPLTERRQQISLMAGRSGDVPDFAGLLAGFNSSTADSPRDEGDGMEEHSTFPTVRR